MLKSIYAKGNATKSKCTENALVQFLKMKKKEGYTLHFVQDEEKGTIIPDVHMTIFKVVSDGQTAVLKSKKSENIIVARKLKDEEINADGDATHCLLTHVYDVISVCSAVRHPEAKHTDRRMNFVK